MTRPGPDVAVPLSERLVETAAEVLYEASRDYENYGDPEFDWPNIDRAYDRDDDDNDDPEWLRNAIRSDARAALAVVLPLLADEVASLRVCAECSDFYSGGRTSKHDLELGCAPMCPCQHKHAEWVGYSDGAVHRVAEHVRSLAEAVRDGR